jgi:hypothetical protein
MIAATMPTLSAGEYTSPQMDPMSKFGGYIMLLLEIASAMVVLMLGVGAVAIAYRIFVYFGTKEKMDPPIGSVTRRTTTKTSTTSETSTQTTAVACKPQWYPSKVYVTNTGSHYHANDRCGGLGSSRSTREVNFCGTCSERARALEGHG